MLRSLEDAGVNKTAAAVRSHFEQFGCRVTAFDPGRPTNEERPGLVLGVLRDLVAGGTGRDALAATPTRLRAAAESTMESAG